MVLSCNKVTLKNRSNISLNTSKYLNYVRFKNDSLCAQAYMYGYYFVKDNSSVQQFHKHLPEFLLQFNQHCFSQWEVQSASRRFPPFCTSTISV